MRSMRAALPARARGGPRRGRTRRRRCQGEDAARRRTPPARRPSSSIYPSLVRVRIGAHRACARPRDAEDRERQAGRGGDDAEGRPPPAGGRLARYQVRDPHGAAAGRPRTGPARRKAGDPPAGPTYASPPETAFRVLTLQHDVASADGRADRRSPTAPAWTRWHDAQPGRTTGATRRWSTSSAWRRRLPPEEDLARVRARKSQEEDAAPTFATVMPNLGPQLDDELQAHRRHQERRHRPHGRWAPPAQRRRDPGRKDQGVRQPQLAHRPAPRTEPTPTDRSGRRTPAARRSPSAETP